MVLEKFKTNIQRLVSRYPLNLRGGPKSFSKIASARKLDSLPPKSEIAFQLVTDRFHFLILGAVVGRLSAQLNAQSKVIVIRATSAAVGTDFLSTLKRTAIMAWLWCRPWINAYGDLIQGVAYRSASWGNPLHDLRAWLKAKQLWKQMQQPGQAVSVCIDNMEVTDLIIDSYLRFKPAPSFNVQDPFVRELIWRALRDLHRANVYFEQTQPSLYLTSYSTYVEHGIPVRMALKHQVPVWSFGNIMRLGKQLTYEDSYHAHNFTTYRSEFEKLENQGQKLQEARTLLENRLNGGVDFATSYMRESAYTHQETPLAQNLKDAVVVFLHDFYDSPHIYPEMVFDDFWKWIVFTIETLTKAGIPFFLKPHPNQIALSDEALDQLKDIYPAVQWLPIKVSNKQLVQAGISCGVTVYGTVAHELAYMGVPSICCAQHPHAAFNFCRTAKTKQEYAQMLLTPTKITLSQDEMRRQALAFFYMHNLHFSEAENQFKQALLKFRQDCNNESITTSELDQQLLNITLQPEFDALMTSICQSVKSPTLMQTGVASIL